MDIAKRMMISACQARAAKENSFRYREILTTLQEKLMDKPLWSLRVMLRTGAWTFVILIVLAPIMMIILGDLMNEQKQSLFLVLTSRSISKGDAIVGEISIANDTETDLNIESNGDLRQYISFEILNKNGQKGYYDNFGMTYIVLINKTTTTTIEKKTTWRGGVRPSSVIDTNSLELGKYEIKAHFRYRDIALESNSIEMTIK